MTRSEKIEQAASNWYIEKYGKHDFEKVSKLAKDDFKDGVKWADENAIISKKLIQDLIDGIKSGKCITMTEYSNTPELQKIFDYGQVSAFELLLTWISYEGNKSK